MGKKVGAYSQFLNELSGGDDTEKKDTSSSNEKSDGLFDA